MRGIRSLGAMGQARFDASCCRCCHRCRHRRRRPVASVVVGGRGDPKRYCLKKYMFFCGKKEKEAGKKENINKLHKKKKQNARLPSRDTNWDGSHDNWRAHQVK